MGEHLAQPLLDRERLEQRLPLLGVDLEIAGDKVGEARRIVDAVHHLLGDLLGQAGLLAELRGSQPHLTVQRLEGEIVGVLRSQLLGWSDHGFEVALGTLAHSQRDAAPLAGHQHLGAAEPALHLLDASHGTDRVQIAGRDVGRVLAL